MIQRTELRNIAIIAHVDHGKTTLVDALFRQGGVFRSNEAVTERMMDCFDLEREKGITIFSKHAAVVHDGVHINIVDTPGHSDFGSEVERILHMVDGVLLLIDAFDGPMPQTQFVLKKSLALGLRPIVVLNKMDRPNARPSEVLDETFDLFCLLGAADAQLDFPVVYCSARNGTASLTAEDPGTDLAPLFQSIIRHVPPPEADTESPFLMRVSQTEPDPYLGTLAIGRIRRGTVRTGESVWIMRPDGTRQAGKAAKLYQFAGMKTIEAKELKAGDIGGLAGVESATVGDTLADWQQPETMPAIHVDEPTISVLISNNTSPLSGVDGGKYLTSRQIRERLLKEAKTNIGYRIEDAADAREGIKVSGRGELHLTILIETLRREGYEIEVGKPQVIFKTIDGQTYEPTQHLLVEVDKSYQGFVIEQMGQRKAQLLNMHASPSGGVRAEFIIPDRTLLGFRSELLAATRGTGIMIHTFNEYQPFKGAQSIRPHGALISQCPGKAVAYALGNLQERGELFISPQDSVYEGMVIGISGKGVDMVVNPIRGKKLTNMRAAGSDDAIMLTPPRILTMEWCLDFIEDDELLEVTPKALRIRKRLLTENERKRARPPRESSSGESSADA